MTKTMCCPSCGRPLAETASWPTGKVYWLVWWGGMACIAYGLMSVLRDAYAIDYDEPGWTWGWVVVGSVLVALHALWSRWRHG